MKRLSLLITFFFVFIYVFGLSKAAQAQTTSASDSAVTPVLTNLPTLFPTVTPTPSITTAFPLLDQLDALANPTSTESAQEPQIEQTNSTATISAIPTSDIVASGSAEDYCLNVPIIMYHHIEPLAIATQLGHPQLTEDSTIFEEHIHYLTQNKYHLLSLGELVHAILTRGTVPSKSVVITIDDGYIDNYTYAFMMAKKYYAIMNFMIPTGLIGEPDYMTWDHLKEMNQSPYVRIYNHTTTHAPLGLIDQSEIVKEVTTANQALKTNLGINNDIVIYPSGNYSDLAIQTLQQLGMIAAVSTDPGTNECISNIMTLPRVRVGNEPIEDYGF
jgi:peptidoglycan/xylan/chitin deacetylase (PgdA/CDA1 family)